MNEPPVVPVAFPPLSSASVRRWKPGHKGPSELLLECRETGLVRLFSRFYAAWPIRRGRNRVLAILDSFTPAASRFRRASFRSASGTPLVIDMTTTDYCYLSGVAPHEPLELAVMMRLARPGDVFCDVGAHRGLFVTHLLGRIGVEGSYHAFEPSQANFDHLQRTFVGLANLHLHRAAVSDTAGEGFLQRSGEQEAFLSSHAMGATKVPIERLDRLFADAEVDRTWIVKIDVEGNEHRVLLGMAGLFARGMQPILMLEYLAEINGQKRTDLDRVLREILPDGYQFFALDASAGGLKPFRIGEGVAPEVCNVLAIPAHAHDRLDGLLGG